VGCHGAFRQTHRGRPAPRKERRTIRVLFVNPGLDLGGAEQSLLLLLPALRERGVDATVALFGTGPFEQRLMAEQFTTMVLPLSRVVRRGTRYRAATLQTAAMLAAGVPAALRLASIIRRERTDIVHTNGAKAHLLGGLAGRLAGCRVVWHVRDFPPSHAAGLVFGHALRRFPDVVIANSAAVADSLRPFGPVGTRILVAPNPVDLGLLAPRANKTEARRELGLPVDAPTVGLVAHLTPWKGHEPFLRIARRVLDEVPNAHFVVAGGSIYETDGHDGYADRLKSTARALDLVDRVTFLGNRDDVAPVLAALDVLVHCPTAPEPFGRVLAEAMAARRPVVAARCGGIPEVVADGKTGFLVDPGDVDEFARHVIRLLNDPALASAMGEAGRLRAEQRFGIDDHADRVHGVYRELCGPIGAAA